jgi:hypothetical protein
MALGIFSAVLTLPPAIVNWHLATTTFDGAADPDAAYPYQQVAAWRALAMGIKGSPLAEPAETPRDPSWASTGVFPDLLLARVARYSRAGFGVAAVAVAIGIPVAVLCARRVSGARGGASGHDPFREAHG